jgi:membrane-associated protease RseP (regulator of RpoE activity)
MTSVEELAPDEHDRAMYKQAAWKRVVVLFAGPGMNFVICLVLIYVIALMWGLPNLHPKAVIGETVCVAADTAPGKPGHCEGQGPAEAAGIRKGDVVVKVGDTPVTTFDDMAAAVRQSHGTVPVVVRRDGKAITYNVNIQSTQRWMSGGKESKAQLATVGAIGVGPGQIGPSHYGVLSAVPATLAFTADLTGEVGKSLVAIPTKVGALVHAIGGGQRDPGTPMSVVGASIIGGDTVDHGLWVAFWFFLAQLNLILGAINLVPLLPFDGGHIAIAVFEKIRNLIRSARGRVAAAPVNYLKLMPATYVVLVFVVGYMLLTVTADVVNPIRLFQ